MKLTVLFSAISLVASLNAADVGFSGMIDADFAGGFADTSGGATGFENPSYLSGLEIDLTTTIGMNDAVSLELYTTMVDGVVPAQGVGNTWPAVAFDGLALFWKAGEATVIGGDVVAAAGQFGYYLHKRSYGIVPETFLRGAGLQYKGLTVYSGMNTPGTLDTASKTWSSFVQYSYTYEEGKKVSMTFSPVAYYTAGEAGMNPFLAGMDANFIYRNAALHGAAGINGDGVNDLGFRLLVEPSISFGSVSLAGAFFMQDSGATPSSNMVTSKTGSAFDDMFVYAEPGYSFNDYFAFGLPVEYHDPSASVTKDESIWVVPTFYMYPAENVEWWVWAQAVLPDGDPEYYFGSEVIANF